MAYRQDRRTIREQYEEHFSDRLNREPQVRDQRVVNIVRRSAGPNAVDRTFDDGQWYGDSRGHHDQRGYRAENTYSSTDHGFSDDNLNLGSFHRNSSPPRREDFHSQFASARDDGRTRRQVEIRPASRPEPYFSSRSQGPPPRSVSDRGDKVTQGLGHQSRGDDLDDYKNTRPYSWDRSPIRKDPQPAIPSRPGSNSSSSRSFSPDRGHSYQQMQQRRLDDTYGKNREPDKPRSLTGHTPSGSVEGSPHSSASYKEETPASVLESEEVSAARKELKLTTEEDLQARRSQAISTKSMEIEKLYRQDCETFVTVVNMLVAKEPSLEQLLQVPLKTNLEELQQRCIDDLTHFITELDQVIQPPASST